MSVNCKCNNKRIKVALVRESTRWLQIVIIGKCLYWWIYTVVLWKRAFAATTCTFAEPSMASRSRSLTKFFWVLTSLLLTKASQVYGFRRCDAMANLHTDILLRPIRAINAHMALCITKTCQCALWLISLRTHALDRWINAIQFRQITLSLVPLLRNACFSSWARCLVRERWPIVTYLPGEQTS